MVNDDRATRRQFDSTRIRSFDLVFDLKARKQWHIIAIAFDTIYVVRHHHTHKGSGLISDIVGINQDLADIGREIITNRTNHQARFKIDQNRGWIIFGGAVDRGPELHKIRHIPLPFFGVATDTSGACNDAHTWGDGQLIHGFAQFLTLFALDTARHTAATWVVGHQD